MKFGKVVCYVHEIILIKHAKPNHVCCFVCYNRVFVITEFYCMYPAKKLILTSCATFMNGPLTVGVKSLFHEMEILKKLDPRKHLKHLKMNVGIT